MCFVELVRSDGACGEGNPGPGTNITAGCDTKSINKCCSAANLCGTECSCEGCINYDSGSIFTVCFQGRDGRVRFFLFVRSLFVNDPCR